MNPLLCPRFIFELLAKANIVYANKNVVVDLLEKIVGYITADGELKLFLTAAIALW